MLSNRNMIGDKASIDAICKFLTQGLLDPETEVVVAVPAVYLEYVHGKLGEGIGVAAQNCYKAAKQARNLGYDESRKTHIQGCFNSCVRLVKQVQQ